MTTRTRPGTTRDAAATQRFIAPQLATLADEAPTGIEWWSETKFDGYRMQCHIVRGAARLISRNGLDWSHRFPGIIAELRQAFRGRTLVLDGEIIMNRNGRSSFQALQSALGADTSKAKFVIFDLIVRASEDLRSLPFARRRVMLAALEEQLDDTPSLSISKPLRGPPRAALARACKRGEEGIVCKRIDMPYESGRSRSWLKVKCTRRQELVVVGFSEPKGARNDVGALLLGVYEEGRLLYAGRVGSGFDERERASLRKRLDRIEVAEPPVETRVAGRALQKDIRMDSNVHWVKPVLVAEISFTEWTGDGLLRHPVYQGLREDKDATSVVREGN